MSSVGWQIFQLFKYKIINMILHWIIWCKSKTCLQWIFFFLSSFPCVCHSLPLRLPLTSLPLTPLLLSSPILPSASFTPTLPLHQRRGVLNRNSLSVSVDLSWWQPQSTTECIFIPYGSVCSLSLYPQPQILLIFSETQLSPLLFFCYFKRQDNPYEFSPLQL